MSTIQQRLEYWKRVETSIDQVTKALDSLSFSEDATSSPSPAPSLLNQARNVMVDPINIDIRSELRGLGLASQSVGELSEKFSLRMRSLHLSACTKTQETCAALISDPAWSQGQDRSQILSSFIESAQCAYESRCHELKNTMIQEVRSRLGRTLRYKTASMNDSDCETLYSDDEEYDNLDSEEATLAMRYYPIMENMYLNGLTHPNKDEKTTFATISGMTYRSVSVWFQNRRERAPKDEKEGDKNPVIELFRSPTPSDTSSDNEEMKEGHAGIIETSQGQVGDVGIKDSQVSWWYQHPTVIDDEFEWDSDLEDDMPAPIGKTAMQFTKEHAVRLLEQLNDPAIKAIIFSESSDSSSSHADYAPKTPSKSSDSFTERHSTPEKVAVKPKSFSFTSEESKPPFFRSREIASLSSLHEQSTSASSPRESDDRPPVFPLPREPRISRRKTQGRKASEPAQSSSTCLVTGPPKGRAASQQQVPSSKLQPRLAPSGHDIATYRRSAIPQLPTGVELPSFSQIVNQARSPPTFKFDSNPTSTSSNPSTSQATSLNSSRPVAPMRASTSKTTPQQRTTSQPTVSSRRAGKAPQRASSVRPTFAPQVPILAQDPSTPTRSSTPLAPPSRSALSFDWSENAPATHVPELPTPRLVPIPLTLSPSSSSSSNSSSSNSPTTPSFNLNIHGAVIVNSRPVAPVRTSSSHIETSFDFTSPLFHEGVLMDGSSPSTTQSSEVATPPDLSTFDFSRPLASPSQAQENILMRNIELFMNGMLCSDLNGSYSSQDSVSGFKLAPAECAQKGSSSFQNVSPLPAPAPEASWKALADKVSRPKADLDILAEAAAAVSRIPTVKAEEMNDLDFALAADIPLPESPLMAPLIDPVPQISKMSLRKSISGSSHSPSLPQLQPAFVPRPARTPARFPQLPPPHQLTPFEIHSPFPETKQERPPVDEEIQRRLEAILHAYGEGTQWPVTPSSSSIYSAGAAKPVEQAPSAGTEGTTAAGSLFANFTFSA